MPDCRNGGPRNGVPPTLTREVTCAVVVGVTVVTTLCVVTAVIALVAFILLVLRR